MGFRSGSYAKVWDIDVRSPRVTSLRISVSRKNRDTGEYVQDFGGYVSCIGDCAQKAAQLKRGDRIKLGDIDVTQTMKDQNAWYTNYKVFSFEKAEPFNNGNVTVREEMPKESPDEATYRLPEVEDLPDDVLPF